MKIFGHANEAPMYKPHPGQVQLTDQVNEMKDNWVKSMNSQMDFLMISMASTAITVFILLFALIAHIYGRL